jgi:hypothetical protein
MRSADISPATGEDRRRGFKEAAAALYGPAPSLEQIVHRVRVAMLQDYQRRGADACAALCKALGAKNSPADKAGV